VSKSIRQSLISLVLNTNTPMGSHIGQAAYQLLSSVIEEVYLDHQVSLILSKYLSTMYRVKSHGILGTNHFVSEYKKVGQFPQKYEQVISVQKNTTELSRFFPTHKYKGAYFSYNVLRGVNGSHKGIRCIRGTLDVNSLILEAYEHHRESLRSKSISSTVHFRKFSVSRMSHSRGGEWTASGGSTSREVEAARRNSLSPVDIDSYSPPSTHTYLGYDTPLTHSIEDTFGDTTITSLEEVLSNYFFEPEVVECLRGLVQWAGEEEWFHNLKLPYSRGILLEGPPGTGKSTVPVVFGEAVGIPVTYIGLEDITNSSFKSIWDNASVSRPCVIVIEELDTFFEGRKPLNDCKLSFELLLSTISGAGSTDGVALFITTNNLDKIDPAIGRPDVSTGCGKEISSRPGRIDTILHLGKMSDTCRRELLTRILCDCPELIEPTFIKTTGCTPAQVEFAAGQAALKQKRDVDEKQKEISSQMEKC
jgi:hypothetical protein